MPAHVLPIHLVFTLADVPAGEDPAELAGGHVDYSIRTAGESTRVGLIDWRPVTVVTPTHAEGAQAYTYEARVEVLARAPLVQALVGLTEVLGNLCTSVEIGAARPYTVPPVYLRGQAFLPSTARVPQPMTAERIAAAKKRDAATSHFWTREVYEDGESSEGPTGVHPGSPGPMVESTSVVIYNPAGVGAEDIPAAVDVAECYEAHVADYIVHAREDLPDALALLEAWQGLYFARDAYHNHSFTAEFNAFLEAEKRVVALGGILPEEPAQKLRG